MDAESLDAQVELLFFLRELLKGREDNMVGLMLLLILGVPHAVVLSNWMVFGQRWKVNLINWC